MNDMKLINETPVSEMLDLLSDYNSQKDVIKLKKQELIDTILTPEIKAQIAAIDAEFADKEITVDEKIKELTTIIEEAVISLGKSAKGKYLAAVYFNGKVTWDSKTLDGYAISHPEINLMRREGKPYIVIRRV